MSLRYVLSLAAPLALAFTVGCSVPTIPSTAANGPPKDAPQAHDAPGGNKAATPPARTLPSGATVSPTADERIGRYTSKPWGFSTNSFWIEGADGNILIDAQFLPSAAVEAVEHIERSTGKPVVTAIVLHSNPDKFNGTAALQARGIEVLTSERVAAEIPAVHDKRKGWFYERYAPDYPQATPRPDVFDATTAELTRAGESLSIVHFPAAQSQAHVVVAWNGHMFVGDLVAHQNHAWLELGLLDAWRDALASLEARGPSRVYPGRGADGGPELLQQQRAYLDEVEASVTALSPRGAPDVAELAKVRRELERTHAGYGYPVFLELGLPAVWRALSAQPSSDPTDHGAHSQR